MFPGVGLKVSELHRMRSGLRAGGSSQATSVSGSQTRDGLPQSLPSFWNNDSEPIFCRGVASVPKVVSRHAADLEQAEMEIRDPSGEA